MESHQDRPDHDPEFKHRRPDREPEFENHLSRLEERAARMTAAGESRVTAGAPGEPVLAAWRHAGIVVRQMPDDPDALRVSVGQVLGGGPESEDDDAYCVFRGRYEEVRTLLRRALVALERRPPS